LYFGDSETSFPIFSAQTSWQLASSYWRGYLPGCPLRKQGAGDFRLMKSATLAQRWACIATLGTLTVSAASAAQGQEFAGRPIACVSLDCAAAAKSYSFEEIPRADTQESTANTTTPPKSATREGVWRKLPSNFVHDQKDMWLFPVQVAQGHHWLPVALVTGATAALIATDPQTMPYFRQTDTFQDSSRALGAKFSGGIIAAVPATFYVVSLIRKDSYGQATSLLAGEAVVDDTILMIVAKAITRRERPTDIPVNGKYSDTFFKSGSGPLGKGSSFPSGHAMMAFSVATIFAHRYREHRWIPYVAYGVAAAISFSRITTGAHFPSDVFFGAATGFAIARFDVLHGQ
jgi:membrane-associated phospholipid phosphatase